MAQVLGCLVASMTAGAALLQWGQPSSTGVSTPSPVELIASVIRQPWTAIEIAPARRNGPEGLIDLRQTHFYVDREGGLRVSDTWTTQKQVSERGVIRIALEPPERSSQIAVAQWRMAEELRDGLISKCRIATGRVTVDDTLFLPTTAAQRATSSPRTTLAGDADLTHSR